MRRVCVLLLFAALLAACREGGEARPATTPVPGGAIAIANGQALTIGVSAALSGDQVNLGRDIAAAVELATRDYGGTLRGHPLRVVAMDDGCTDAERAAQVARSFTADPLVAGVIGPMCTVGAQAANALYETAAVAHLAASATRVELSAQGEQFFFRTAWRDDVQAATQADFLRDGGATSVVVVDDGEPYGTALADEFIEAFEAAGGSAVSRERIVRGTREFAPLARQIAGAAPDAVMFAGFNPEGALLLVALRQDGYTGTFIGPDALLSARDFLVTAGPAAEGAVLTGGATPDPDFVARFSAQYQREPGTPFVLQAYDATMLLLQAVEAVAHQGPDGGLLIDRTRLAQMMHSAQSDGLTGTIAFDEHGDRAGESAAEVGLAIYRVREGRFQVVE